MSEEVPVLSVSVNLRLVLPMVGRRALAYISLVRYSKHSYKIKSDVAAMTVTRDTSFLF